MRKIDSSTAVCYAFCVRVSGCLFGGVMTTALGIAWKVLKFVLEVIAKAIFYFGLYVPLGYLLYGLALFLIFGFDPFVMTVNGRLYFFGLALCFGCSLTITIRSLVIRPIKNYFNGRDVIEYGSAGKKPPRGAPEAPKIYKSRVNKGVIVYEYANRYDLYEEMDGGLVLVKTEWKDSPKRK